MSAALACGYRPKSYPGFRKCVSRILAPLAARDVRVRKLCLCLCDTGYEAGPFLQEIFNAWDTYRIEGCGSDAWVLAWDIVHDAVVCAFNGGDAALSESLLSLCPV